MLFWPSGQWDPPVPLLSLVEASTVSGTACPLTAHPCPRCGPPRGFNTRCAARETRTPSPFYPKDGGYQDVHLVIGFTAQSPGDHAAPHALLNCSLSGGDLSFNGSWDDWDWPALRSGRHKHIHIEALMNVPSVPNGERGTGFEPACAYLEGRWVAVTLPARLCYLPQTPSNAIMPPG